MSQSGTKNQEFDDPSKVKVKQDSEKWLSAHYNPVANIHTLSQCITFSDVSADGDYKLILTDFGTQWKPGQIKLKVYKGTNLMAENNVLEMPTAVTTVYMDANFPRTPVIAMAAGSFVYVYKNLRPYYRFTMPDLDVDKTEQEVWKQLKENRIQVPSLVETLDALKAQGIDVTSRTMSLLNLPPTEHESFAMKHKDSPLRRQTVITCVATLKKSMPDQDAIDCLVLGTESKQVFVLDPQAFTVLSAMQVAAVPAFLEASGLYDVEFTIIIGCRNGGVYGLKRGSKEGRLLFQLRSHLIGIKRINKMIIVACMDDTLQSFSIKGKQQWSVKLPASVLAMELLDHKPRNVQGVLVALSNNEVRTYIDKNHIDTIELNDTCLALKFGRFGREESTLVIITKGGALWVKMLKRTVFFANKSPTVGPPAAQQQKMDIPKKTKLFLDQTVRERETGTEMYRQFQHDLYRMRLETARNYVGVLQKSMMPVSVSQTDPVKLHVEVTGIGPVFKLSIHIQNTSSSQPSFDLCVTFDYDNRLYAIRKPYIAIPMLVPGLDYIFETLVQCLSDKGISDIIKVFVLKKNISCPLITAVVNMPVSEPVMLP